MSSHPRAGDWVALFEVHGYEMTLVESIDEAELAAEDPRTDVLVVDARVSEFERVVELFEQVPRHRPPVRKVLMHPALAAKTWRRARQAAHPWLTPCPPDHDQLDALLALVDALAARGFVQVPSLADVAPAHGQHGLVGDSSPMRRLYEDVDVHGPKQLNVLLAGDPGVEAAAVARALHAASGLSEQPFEEFHFGAARDVRTLSWLEAAFDDAAGGTLFLADVHFADQGVQERLEAEIGARARAASPIRFVASVPADMVDPQRDHGMRRGLISSLRQTMIEIPDLRSRITDLDFLVKYHLPDICSDDGGRRHRVTQPGMDVLRAQAWEGNVGELRQVLKTAGHEARGSDIGPEHLPKGFRLIQLLKEAHKPVDPADADDGMRAVDPASGQFQDAATPPAKALLARDRRRLFDKFESSGMTGASFVSVQMRALKTDLAEEAHARTDSAKEAAALLKIDRKNLRGWRR